MQPIQDPFLVAFIVSALLIAILTSFGIVWIARQKPESLQPAEKKQRRHNNPGSAEFEIGSHNDEGELEIPIPGIRLQKPRMYVRKATIEYTYAKPPLGEDEPTMVFVPFRENGVNREAGLPVPPVSGNLPASDEANDDAGIKREEKAIQTFIEKGVTSPTEIARQTGIPRTTIMHRIERMQKEGLLQVKPPDITEAVEKLADTRRRIEKKSVAGATQKTIQQLAEEQGVTDGRET